MNFTFTSLDEGRKAISVEGLAIIQAEELGGNEDSTCRHLQVEMLHSIEIDKQKFNIVFHLGGDWKFLALVTG